jgi:hypothetical protein
MKTKKNKITYPKTFPPTPTADLSQFDMIALTKAVNLLKAYLFQRLNS